LSVFYVVGGRVKAGLKPSPEEWRYFAAGLIVSVNSETGALRSEVEYVSPPEVCPDDDPSIVFKTGTLIGNRLYVPTQTEVMIYDVPSFRPSGYASIACFNDVHHVRPGPDGTLIVANTGLDMVVEVAVDGTVRKEWSTIGEELWTRFSRDVDYRKVPTTKPHRSHPNHTLFLNGDLWVTRCDQHDLLCLTAETAPIAIADKWIHDGLVHGQSIYFTAVNGQVIVVDAGTQQVRERHDLNAIAGGETPLGWCRGIEVLDDDHVVVGFSRFRRTKWKQKVQWVKHRLGGDGSDLLPTRIVLFDLRRQRVCWEVDLEPVGMNVVFSIHDATSLVAGTPCG
jgi:hypothetical protein